MMGPIVIAASGDDTQRRAGINKLKKQNKTKEETRQGYVITQQKQNQRRKKRNDASSQTLQQIKQVCLRWGVHFRDDDDDEGPIEQKQNQRIALLVSIIKWYGNDA